MKALTLPLLAGLLSTLVWTGCSPRASAPADAHAGHAHAARPAAGAAPAAAPARCAAHGLPRERCFICDPALRTAGRLWCNEHQRYEDRCWTCHPEARDPQRAFCDEHGLYENECFLCHPELSPAPAPQAALNCQEHGVPEAQCGICHPDEVGRLQPGQSLQVRLASPDSAALAGVKTAPPSLGALTQEVVGYAELAFDQNRLAQIPAPVGGIIQEVLVDLGAPVRENQPVARIWSATIAEAVAKAVLSHQTLDRERRLRASRVTAEKELQQAEAEHRAACQQLRTLGFTEEQVDILGAKPQESVLLDVRAPFAGELIERTAVRGAWVEAGRSLFTLANRSNLWAVISLPESALAQVRVGQSVQLTLEALPGRVFSGVLTWIAAEVDEHSRRVRARAELANPEGLLKARMFAQARIATQSRTNALLLPASALQWVEDKPLVFVQMAADLFAARGVRLGARSESRCEIVEGLRPDEPVVVEHGFALKSALLISRLGAGCADD